MSSVEQHQRLICALQSASVYPHPVTGIRLVQTHISSLILTGDYVYKLKKPVSLGFLDFGTLEKRRFCCKEELRLNRRLAPDIYLDVVSITGSFDQPEINGSGEVLEYAVQMRQFEADNTLDLLLANDASAKIPVAKLAEHIADFHSKAKVAGSETPYGSPEKIVEPMLENFTQIRAHLGGPIFYDYLRMLEGCTRLQARRYSSLMERRKQQGFIRECHGDMHLGNIALSKGELILFDGIEFSPELRWIDTMSDLAFLLMDLEDHHRQSDATRLLDSYLTRTGDFEGLPLLPFYKGYRALVRAKVAAISYAQQSDETGKENYLQQVAEYIHRANISSEPRRPLLVLMHGLSGSGKSWLSEQLLDHLPMIRLRSDIERKRECESATDYKESSRDAVYERLLQLAETVLSCGMKVVVDATFLKQELREQFADIAVRQDCGFAIVSATAPAEVLEQRIQQRTSDQQNVSDATHSVLQLQLQTQDCLSENEPHIVVDTQQPLDFELILAFLEQQTLRPMQPQTTAPARI